MTRMIRRVLVVLCALFFLGLVSVAALVWITHVREATYYDSYSNILPVGTRIFVAEDFASAGSDSVAKTTSAVVKTDPAWDEDSCDPERPITVTLDSGRVVSVPRHILHR
jgi:hypothetical protein